MEARLHTHLVSPFHLIDNDNRIHSSVEDPSKCPYRRLWAPQMNVNSFSVIRSHHKLSVSLHDVVTLEMQILRKATYLHANSLNPSTLWIFMKQNLSLVWIAHLYIVCTSHSSQASVQQSPCFKSSWLWKAQADHDESIFIDCFSFILRSQVRMSSSSDSQQPGWGAGSGHVSIFLEFIWL